MSLNAHLDQLKKKHDHLKMEVAVAQRAPGYDEMQLATLKKQKLRLKEQIERLSS